MKTSIVMLVLLSVLSVTLGVAPSNAAYESLCGADGALTFCVTPGHYHSSDKYITLSYRVLDPQATNVSFIATLNLSRHFYIIIEIPSRSADSFVLAPKTPPGYYWATGYLWQVDHAIARVDLLVEFGGK